MMFDRFWAVGVGGVEVVDAEGDRAAQQVLRGVGVGGMVPVARAGQLHGAVAKPVHRQVAADEVLTGGVYRVASTTHQAPCPVVASAARRRSGMTAAICTATRSGGVCVVSTHRTDTPRCSRCAAASPYQAISAAAWAVS